MQAPAPVAVPVEVRALDTGERLDRVWRLTRSIGEDGLVFSRELPFEPGRPVRLSLVLPDDESGLELTGVVQGVAPDDPEREGERASWRAVSFVALDAAVRLRIERYVQERMLLP